MRLSVSCSFALYDGWMGVFYDRRTKAVYICLLPFLPIRVGRPLKHTFSDGLYLYAAETHVQAQRMAAKLGRHELMSLIPDNYPLALPYGSTMPAVAFANGEGGDGIWRGYHSGSP